MSLVRVLCGALLAAGCAVSAIATDLSPVWGVEMARAQQAVFRAALERVAPLVVRIDTIGGAQQVRIAGDEGEERTQVGFRQADGPTTGVIWTTDGYILTSSFNFLREPAIITVTLSDGRRFVARLVARDRQSRLALLKIAAEGLPAPQLLSPAELRPGQWALAAGMGHGGDSPLLSVGVVSALRRAGDMAIQTDAKTSPANYGGPLFDVEGRVLGVCVPLSPGEDDEVAGLEWYDSGIGFAIHTEQIAARLPRLMEGRDLRRGLLGVALDPGDRVVGESDDGQPAGLRVLGEPRGPALEAGLRTDDVITHVAGQPVPTLTHLRRVMARHAAGDEVEVRYWRDGDAATARLRLAAMEELRPPAPRPAPAPVPEP